MLVKVYPPYCTLPFVDAPEASATPIPEPIAAPRDPVENTCEARIRQLEQQVRLGELLNEINNAVRSTLDFDRVLQTACTLLASTFDCSRVSILVNEAEHESVLITRGEYKQDDYPSQQGLKVPIDDNPHLQQLMRQNEPLAVTRFDQLPGMSAEVAAIVEGLGIKSMLAIATRYQGEVNGILGIHQCDRYREWTEWECQLLEGVASQLAIAINQARLYSATRAAAERESLLRLVTDQIRSTLDLQTILKTAVRGVRELLATDRVVIYQFTEDWQGEIVVEDLAVPWPSIFGQEIGDNCFKAEYGERYKNGRVRAIDDIHTAGLDPCHVNFLAQLNVKANAIVPIAIADRLWGLLIAHQCDNPRRWQDHEIDLLQQLGDRLAIAIGQAELYAQVRESANRYQTQTEQLQATLEELQTTQQQLLQSEKLSSLGQMVAGIAHEINNANNFIHANVPHARDYAQSLERGLQRYATLIDAPEAIAAIDSELDLDYIREDFSKILTSMSQGSERIRSIILTLRNFAHLDEAEYKLTDVNEGLETTLTMLQHRLTPAIAIHKELAALPKIYGFPGQLNQVFFNLLANAIDAIETQKTPGQLTLSSRQIDRETIAISIGDNGPGIDPDIQKQIFDPFFTTKPVGKGTGLGLSLCYQAVVKGHGGRIYCDSEPGRGTTFTIELPVRLEAVQVKG